MIYFWCIICDYHMTHCNMPTGCMLKFIAVCFMPWSFCSNFLQLIHHFYPGISWFNTWPVTVCHLILSQTYKVLRECKQFEKRYLGGSVLVFLILACTWSAVWDFWWMNVVYTWVSFTFISKTGFSYIKDLNLLVFLALAGLIFLRGTIKQVI